MRNQRRKEENKMEKRKESEKRNKKKQGNGSNEKRREDNQMCRLIVILSRKYSHREQ